MKDAKLATETRLHPRGDMRDHRVDIVMVIIKGREVIITVTGRLHLIICEVTGMLLLGENTSRT